MKKYINYIIAAIVIAGVFLAAWFAGTPADKATDTSEPEKIQSEETGELYTEENKEEPVLTQPDGQIAQEEEAAQKTPAQQEAPVTEEETPPEPENAVSLTVDCSDILTDIDSLKKEKHGLVPDSGIMFSATDVEITEGESVFDVLKRALTASGVHLEFNLAPVTNSAYIEGIGNIYEFDCGERSGWKYSVNGEYPRVGCSDYKVKPGDKIVFVYKVKAY